MTKLNEKIDELQVGYWLQMISSNCTITISLSYKLSTFASFFQAQMDELKTDLGKAKRGKPLGNDKDGKPKRNLPPET